MKPERTECSESPFRAVIVCACVLLMGFAGGMITAHQVYAPETSMADSVAHPGVHAAKFIPLAPPPSKLGVDRKNALPTVDVIDIEAVRSLAGRRARVRGKIYRVGHSTKSNTTFLDFGPSRSSFTALIFASAANAFEREHIEPRRYEGKEVEIVGTIEDDPRYGLEMIIENPAQIRELE